MRHVWSVLCSRMITDRDTNSASLENIIEELKIEELPKNNLAIPIEMHLGSLWMREDVKSGELGFARLSLIAPSGKVLGQWEPEIDLTNHVRMRYKLGIRGFPANEAGVFIFRVDKRESKQQRWKTVAEVPLQVAFASFDEEE